MPESGHAMLPLLPVGVLSVVQSFIHSFSHCPAVLLSDPPRRIIKAGKRGGGGGCFSKKGVLLVAAARTLLVDLGCSGCGMKGPNY